MPDISGTEVRGPHYPRLKRPLERYFYCMVLRFVSVSLVIEEEWA